jgi:hypothetical protein
MKIMPIADAVPVWMTADELEGIRSELGAVTQMAMADLLQCDYVGYKRWATGFRPIPAYIARSARALLFIQQNKLRTKYLKYLEIVE